MPSRDPILFLTALLVATPCFADDSQPGAFPVSQRTVTVARPNGSSFSAQIRYPAQTSAANAAFAPGAAPAPAVSFGHGFLSAVDLYDSTMDHLASHGFIVIATTSEGSLLPNHANFALDIRHCLTWLEQQDALASSWLAGAVDEARFAVAGHSMGGGASALAAAADPRIRCMATLAAAETNPSSSAAAASIQVPSRFIVGSQDSIVPPANTQPQYANCDAPRQFTTIVGGSHCGFIDSAIIACDSGSITRAEQLAKTRALLLEFLGTHLRGDGARFAAVWGAGTPVAGTTTVRDPRMSASLSHATIKGVVGEPVLVTVTVTNAGPDATAFRARLGSGALDVAFEPAETPVLAAGQSASITASVRALAAGSVQANIEVVRVRDGAGASLALTGSFVGGAPSGDLDGDGDADAADLAALLNAWGPCKGCPADFDGNGQVDAADLAVVLNAWG